MFSLFFKEQYREAHGNHFWGLFATLVLMTPFIFVFYINQIELSQQATITSKVKRNIIVFLICTHLISGIFYSLAYPFRHIEPFPNTTITALKDLQHQVPVQTSFLFDPSFPDDFILMAYLARPSLWNYFSCIHSEKQYFEWLVATKKQISPLFFIKDYDAFVVGPKTRWMVPILKKRGWFYKQSIPTKSQSYEVWLSSRLSHKTT